MNRQPKGAPDSAGGQFGVNQKSESPSGLSREQGRDLASGPVSAHEVLDVFDMVIAQAAEESEQAGAVAAIWAVNALLSPADTGAVSAVAAHLSMPEEEARQAIEGVQMRARDLIEGKFGHSAEPWGL